MKTTERKYRRATSHPTASIERPTVPDKPTLRSRQTPVPSFPTILCRILLTLACVACVVTVRAQQSSQSPPPGNGTASQTEPPNNLPPMQIDTAATLHHLNQVIGWYRHVTTSIQSVGLPSDAIYEDNTKSLGTQAVRLAFDSARAEAALAAAEQKASGGESSHETTQEQALADMQAKTKAKIDQLQSQIADLDDQIAKARGSKRSDLVAQRDAVEGELNLQKALSDALQKMAAFVESNGEISGGLQGGINQLARSIPEVLGTNSSDEKKVTTPIQSKPSLANSGGLISEAITLYDYMSSVHQMEAVIRETNYTREVADHLRTPIRNALKATIQRSEALANQPVSANPAELKSQRENFQQLTDRFKQLSAALMPLSQEIIVLDDSKTNLEEWRSSIARESGHVLRSVLLRVLGILLALAVILIVSEVWRRITFRYVGDPRRRRQFLVLRRVIIGFLITIVLILGFISEVSSLATFAGFITAGIAVGLQAVLLSVAAYFFIIGRYGIRVGDRISVAGVTGDVVDIGLIRLYLMELAGTGLDFYPTGRIVVFSNAVLFQTATPLFKQIPGTEYAWHEVVVMIAPEGNHKAAEDKLVAVVNQVYSQYKHEIERQHAGIERRVDIQVQAPRPEARIQFADNGLELLVRYPVEIRKAPDIDEEMTRKVLQLIETDAALKAAVSGTPKIRSAIKG